MIVSSCIYIMWMKHLYEAVLHQYEIFELYACLCNRKPMSATALSANVGLMCRTVAPGVFLGSHVSQKDSICLLCIFCMVSAWIQQINTENSNHEKLLECLWKVRCAKPCSLFNGTYTACLGLAQFIDCCKKSTVASSLAALSPHNRLHSHRPFILRAAPGDKWT